MASQVYADKSRLLPPAMIKGLVALVVAALAFAAYARLTDRPLASQTPDAAIATEAVVLLRSNIASGEVWIMDPSGHDIAHMAEGAGFIATLHRVVLRERGKHKVAADAPIHLRAFENGRYGLFDPTTGLTADLSGYGPSNTAAINELITTANATNGGRTDGTAD